jgi:hypothetical protein
MTRVLLLMLGVSWSDDVHHHEHALPRRHRSGACDRWQRAKYQGTEVALPAPHARDLLYDRYAIEVDSPGVGEAMGAVADTMRYHGQRAAIILLVRTRRRCSVVPADLEPLCRARDFSVVEAGGE